MRPSEVREHVLHDHAALRTAMVEIEALARGIAGGGSGDVGVLRARTEALLQVLAEHMRWEDRFLAPALAETVGWGPERAEFLREDHREQREYLRDLIAQLRDDGRRPMAVADLVVDFVARLRADMEDEETFLLGPEVLRDDVVAIDLEAG